MDLETLELVCDTVRRRLGKDNASRYEPLLTRISKCYMGSGDPQDSYPGISYAVGLTFGNWTEIDVAIILMATLNILDLEERSQVLSQRAALEEDLKPYKVVLQQIYPTRLSCLGE